MKADFSSCVLPYSQALDVSRTYLRHLGSSRFEEMRTFRKCITEFVLDPGHEPAGFQSWLWRYPVRIDIAIEYLGITPEEYAVVFRGAEAPPCGAAQDDAAVAAARGNAATGTAAAAGAPDAAPGGAADAAASQSPAVVRGAIGLPAFLDETCLSYCEFYELWQSGFVAFRNGADQKNGAFPPCEPCCPDDLWLQFPEGEKQQQQYLTELLVFIRLCRKLKDSCCYSFAQLRDICDVLQLYAGGALLHPVVVVPLVVEVPDDGGGARRFLV